MKQNLSFLRAIIALTGVGLLILGIFAAGWVGYKFLHRAEEMQSTQSHAKEKPVFPDWAVIKVDGRVIDQYDHPLPYARIQVSWGEAEKDLTFIFSDKDGRFHYDSSPRQFGLVGFCVVDTVFQDGTFYDYSCKDLAKILGYSSESGWYHDNMKKKDPDYIFTLKGIRSGVPEPMIYFERNLPGGNGAVSESGLDVLTGEVKPLPCDDCDLHFKLLKCDNGKIAVEVTPGLGGGLQLILLKPELRPAKHEAPLSGYQERVRIHHSDCSPWAEGSVEDDYSKWPSIYFYSRKKQLFGVAQMASPQRDLTAWGGVNITANPRGSRNLHEGRRGIGIPPILLPVKEIPYKDPLRFDLSKITVSRDPKTKIFTFIGAPGAAKGIEKVAVNNASTAELKDCPWVDVNQEDASFKAQCKGDFVDLIYLVGNYQHGECYLYIGYGMCAHEHVPLYKLKNISPPDDRAN